MTFKIDQHVDNAVTGVVGAITVFLAFGIGGYILLQFNAGTNNSLKNVVDAYNGLSGIVTTVVTIILVGVLAGVGIGLINLMRRKE